MNPVQCQNTLNYLVMHRELCSGNKRLSRLTIEQHCPFHMHYSLRRCLFERASMTDEFCIPLTQKHYMISNEIMTPIVRDKCHNIVRPSSVSKFLYLKVKGDRSFCQMMI